MLQSSSHEYFMQKALALALKAKGMTSPNPMVGAVLVKNGRIIAEGYHRRCGEDHAEIVALNQAGLKAKGATLYVTLEPCHHFGRTPPCVDAVIKSQIKEVVIAHLDPNPLTSGKSVKKLKRAGIKVEVGVLKEECQKANEIFMKYITKKMPFVVAKSAQSLDGKIALANGLSKWITSENSRAHAHNIRDTFDAIMVGINTVLQDDPRLTGVRKDKRLKKIIVDSSLKVSLQANLFKSGSASDCYVLTTAKAGRTKIKVFREKGVNVIICPAQNGRVNLTFGLKALAKMEISSVLIEGGANLIGSALKDDLVDKLHIYVAPMIVGDEKALNSIVNLTPKKLSQAVQLKDVEIKRIGEDIFLSAYVHWNR